VNVRASQARNATGAITRAVSVLDVNDNSPIFTQPDGYTFNVSEAWPANVSFGTVTATDRDAGAAGELLYRVADSLDGADEGEDNPVVSSPVFAVNSATGYVFMAPGSATLDYEGTRRYSFDVEALDASDAPLTTRVTVVVMVTNVNDNAPSLTGTLPAANGPSLVVSEDVARGTIIATVAAEDLDGDAVEIFLACGIPETAGRNTSNSSSGVGGDGRIIPCDADTFLLHNTTGEITTNLPLDRETTSEYLLTVSAIDNGMPPLRTERVFAVSVGDVNDNSPRFVDDQGAAFVVREDAPAGTIVGVIKAADPDAGANGTLSFRILKGRGDDIFTIGKADGVLRTRCGRGGDCVSVLDYESDVRELSVTVYVTDHGLPTSLVSSFRPFTITVTDANDNRALFTQPAWSAEVAEDAPIGTIVVVVTATDADAPPNDYWEYQLLQGNVGGAFAIDPATGAIMVARPLDAETLGYVLP